MQNPNDNTANRLMDKILNPNPIVQALQDAAIAQTPEQTPPQNALELPPKLVPNYTGSIKVEDRDGCVALTFAEPVLSVAFEAVDMARLAMLLLQHAESAEKNKHGGLIVPAGV